MTYYTYNADTKRLTPVGRVIELPDGSRIAQPTVEQYAAIDAHPRGNSPAPTPPEGKIVVCDGYSLRDGAWIALWSLEDMPDPLCDKPLAGITIPSSPSQNNLNEVVKQVVTRLGGEVEQ